MRDLSIDLRRSSVTPNTVSRYAIAIGFFLNYLFLMEISLGPSPSEAFLDETVCDYCQWLYSNGLPKFQRLQNHTPHGCRKTVHRQTHNSAEDIRYFTTSKTYTLYS